MRSFHWRPSTARLARLALLLVLGQLVPVADGAAAVAGAAPPSRQRSATHLSTRVAVHGTAAARPPQMPRPSVAAAVRSAVFPRPAIVRPTLVGQATAAHFTPRAPVKSVAGLSGNAVGRRAPAVPVLGGAARYNPKRNAAVGGQYMGPSPKVIPRRSAR
jgi:hypothetical protein